MMARVFGAFRRPWPDYAIQCRAARNGVAGFWDAAADLDSCLPSRIGKKQTPPATAIKRCPRTLRLGKSVGNRINGRRIDGQSAMASFHFNAFRLSRGFLYTALPRANPVRTAINRRCGNCRRIRNIVDIVHRLAAGQFIISPGICGFGTLSERASKRNYGANAVRQHFCEFARIDATEAPPHDADLTPVHVAKIAHEIEQMVLNSVGGLD